MLAQKSINFTAVNDWLFDQALPFWAEAGVDRVNGGFVEHLTLKAENAHAPFKRVRAQARQIYCFSQAALLGWSDGAAVADHGWDFLQRHGRREDGAWVRRLAPDGSQLDTTCDAYDMAFVLFAHAWRHKVTKDPAVEASALATLDALDRTLAHPSGLGWLAEEGDAGPRQQNPHMHLIEAAIELAETTGNERFQAFGRTIAALFGERILNRETGVLREFFAPDWSALDTPAGRIVEPGHQLEWAWILERAAPILEIDMSREADLLHAHAEKHGIAPVTGLTYDQVDVDGKVILGDHRSWPQTEALKANLAMLEGRGLDTRDRIAVCVDNLLERYLAPAPTGTWIDQLDSKLKPRVDKIPSTTLYHVQLAFTELLRLQPAIQSMDADAA
ncbi:AGE family epimerase/isomerase [Caulobacter endophyticus]|uniref:Mannose-6-phosphate isomerase n=1 Tax=Caulobacter endophyticus TaxID=2172652 RepID=A0A2T9JZV5_9CAUL|nr:AGE family epimerase/isomerase [Caulobacter endophyticus]PVM89163.1 mannose-6-phosphate isomerase [Caulobacter endophyticus]